MFENDEMDQVMRSAGREFQRINKLPGISEEDRKELERAYLENYVKPEAPTLLQRKEAERRELDESIERAINANVAVSAAGRSKLHSEPRPPSRLLSFVQKKGTAEISGDVRTRLPDCRLAVYFPTAVSAKSRMQEDTMRSILMAFILAVAVMSAAPSVSIEGKWFSQQTMERGGESIRVTRTLDLKADGEKLTGTLTVVFGDMEPQKLEIKDGRFTDGKFSFTVSASTPNGEFTRRYEGSVEGDTMKGTSSGADGGDSVQFEAKRQ